MVGCKYCTPDECEYDSYEDGDRDGVNILVGATDESDGGTLWFSVYYKEAEMETFGLPVVACPFCGRRLGK